MQKLNGWHGVTQCCFKGKEKRVSRRKRFWRQRKKSNFSVILVSSPLYTDACFSRKHPPSSFIQLTLPTSTICAPGTCAGQSVYAICFLGWSSLETIRTSRGLMLMYAPVLMKGHNLLGRNYVSFMWRRWFKDSGVWFIVSSFYCAPRPLSTINFSYQSI
jgi:hypothetical protein